MTCIETRTVDASAARRLADEGIHPALARIYAARGIRHANDLDDGLTGLIPPDRLRGAAEAAVLLADAIEAEARMLIVADYDCDGATACAVGVRGLRAMSYNFV